MVRHGLRPLLDKGFCSSSRKVPKVKSWVSVGLAGVQLWIQALKPFTT